MIFSSRDFKPINAWIASGLLALSVGLAYFNAPKGDFIWDDRGLIFGDWSVQKGGVAKFFQPSYWREIPEQSRGRFRPLRAVFFTVDYELYGENPAGYHVTNILFHFGCSLLLFMVARKLGLGGIPSLVAALLFSLHPVHTESVTWIKNRSDLIATFFVLASFYAFLAGRAVASLLLFVPALLSKETALAYPVILALYLLCREKNAGYYAVAKRILPFAVAALLFLLLTAIFWRSGQSPAIAPDAKDHLQMVLLTLGLYAKLLFVPWPLKAEHEFEPPLLWNEPYLLLGVLVAGVLVLLWRCFRDKDYTFYSLAAFAGLLPVLNLHYLSSRLLAEQRLYLASVFICLLAASWLRPAAERFGTAAVGVGAAVLLSCFGMMTFSRNKVWQSDASFWEETVRQNPRNYRSNMNLSAVYQLRGDYSAAYEYAKKASAGWDAPNVFYSLGFLADKLGRTDEAITHYRDCLMHGGNTSPDVYNNLGIAYLKKGEGATAIENFRNALQVDPAYSPAYRNLSAYYSAHGDPVMAAEYERRAAGEGR